MTSSRIFMAGDEEEEGDDEVDGADVLGAGAGVL